MTKLLKYKDRWSDESIKWLESDLSMAIARDVRRHPNFAKGAEDFKAFSPKGRAFTFAADQNAGKRSKLTGGNKKAEGMTAGEPDLRFYIEGRHLVLIELKRKGNYLSPVQRKRIALLEALAFTCYTVTTTCPDDGIKQVMAILDEELKW